MSNDMEAKAGSVDSLAALLIQAEVAGAKKERAAVVRFLRGDYAGNLFATLIERGDHLRGEGA